MSKIQLRFLPPIPDGLAIYLGEEEPAGVGHRLNAALAFANRRDHCLRLAPEPDNPHDPNAIAVIGTAKGWFLSRDYKLGYLKRDDAAVLGRMGLAASVVGRIRNIWVSDNDFVSVKFDVLGPKDRRKEFYALQAEMSRPS